MILQVMAIRDLATEAYGRPLFMPAIGAAVRAFYDEINRNDKDNPYFQHPEDYILYHLGEFDDNTGIFNLLTVPKQVATGKENALPRT